MGYVDRASRSRIDSDKVVNCMTSDSLFRVKISGTTYTGSFIRPTMNQQKEAPITECKHVMYSTESRLSLEVPVFWLATVEVLSSWIGPVEPSVVPPGPVLSHTMFG